MSAPDGNTLWHGRFEGGPAAELLAYTESLSFDSRLWPDDIEGSRAHVRGLAHVGLLTTAEREELTRLCKENRGLRMERDILKKASAFFFS